MILVHGADQLAGGLVAVLKDLTAADKAVGSALTARAKSRAPVRTGRLRASLRAVEGSVQSNLVYGPPIHWGWRKRHIRANPFAWKAALSNEDEWSDIYAQEIQRKLDEL